MRLSFAPYGVNGPHFCLTVKLHHALERSRIDFRIYERCAMKNVIAITVAAVAIFSVGAAEATPVTNGFHRSTTDFQDGMFSGNNFAVSNINVGGGFYFLSNFNTGTLNGGVGTGTIFNSPSTTIQIGGNSCTPVAGAM